MKQTRVKGMKGFLLYDPVERSFYFRVYDKDHNFVDYDIVHSDLEVEILSDDAVVRQTKNGTPFIDYSDEVLGYTTER